MHVIKTTKVTNIYPKTIDIMKIPLETSKMTTLYLRTLGITSKLLKVTPKKKKKIQVSYGGLSVCSYAYEYVSLVK